MADEISAGAILCSFNSDLRRVEYLLLNYSSGHWDFPKGNVETGENGLQTATREILEETGINEIIFVDGFVSTIEYYYKRSSKLIHKFVTFYLAKTCIRDVRLSFEHCDFSWKEYDLAINQLTYKSAKKILREAKPYTESIKWI
jgi:8-oxo-dGTP pyrophosphatase MutT (NUDIX family)